ncbi:DUF1634 domain-containing protein [Paraburkholderia sp. BCC1884]|uniref:DUF1634 domain-containing protein n=1 Tax=Paraburkholderia sp. BCC1884 TaxID=2562668 RepID=UPI0021B23C04|nr:DUF1634 domain-containing protein [Paraburkholderia sp. BCC1884]
MSRMSRASRRDAATGAHLERWLANLLHYGTWLAASTIAIGLVMASAAAWAPRGSAGAAVGMRIMSAGIALFILLPIMRLILMLGVFVRQRDYRFGAIAALVLAIVATGLLIGAA